MQHIFVAFKDFKNTRGKERWKAFGKIAGFFAGILFLIVAGVFIYFAKDLPSPGKINTRFIAESTKIYDRTGQHILYDIHGEEKRTIIPFSEMPESIRYATIALEDQEFYSHYGIKFTSIIRSVIADILHRKATQGGSTITQQFIKQSVLTPEKTLSRKIKEVILSLELEQKFSKDEILGMYLNESPYGSNAYGIEAGAQTFFGKHARELSLDEAALLAALPNAPTYYSPFGSHPEALKARQEYALKRMASLGYITEDQAREAITVDVLGKISPYAENISAPHFVMYVKEYLENKYGEQAIEQSGLKVYTTLDWDKQQIAEKSVRDGADANAKKYRASNAALVALDPKTGQILAMVGSKNYFDKSIDGQVNVAIRDRQPGSSFKPFVYLTAFEKGYTPDTMLWDVDTNFDMGSGKDYRPKNYDGKNRGPLKMKEALAMSLNVPAVETLYLAGVKNSIETAKKMGITTLNNPDRYGLSLVLGGGEVKLLDHVNAYGTLATGGIYRPKTAILKIVDSAGNILEEFKDSPGQRVVDEKHIAALDNIMSTNSLRAPVFGSNNPLNFPDRPVAAKTGTTNEWRDGWTVGYTPSLVAGVWVGNNNNSVMAQGADGIYVAAPIWRNFMNQVLVNYNTEQFPNYQKEETGKPVLDGDLDTNGKELKVCKIPEKKDRYCLATDACPDDTREKKEFFDGHSILYYVNKDDPRGDYPKNPADDPQFSNWEKAVVNWIKDSKDFKKKLKKDPAPDLECRSSDFDNSSSDLSVEITSPENDATITSSSFNIRVSATADAGIERVAIFVDGEEVFSEDAKSVNYSYSVPPEKKSASLNIKAVVTDNNGDTDSSSITVATEIS